MRGEPTRPLVLGLETSCDETAAAVLSGDHRILGHVILSQDIHEVYGGVVPELAARAHLQKIDHVIGQTLTQAGVPLDDIDVFGVTAGPGLIGALLVGVSWVKAVAYALGKPWISVHHMEAHLFSPSLEDEEAQPPFVALLVSGGHTLLLHATAWGEYRSLGRLGTTPRGRRSTRSRSCSASRIRVARKSSGWRRQVMPSATDSRVRCSDETNVPGTPTTSTSRSAG